MLATAQELFDLSVDAADLKGAYSSALLNARGLLVSVYEKLAITNPKLTLSFVYCSRGDSTTIGESVKARSEQIRIAAAGFFSDAIATFTFMGATELIDRQGNLRRYLFDSNVRDYLGENKVNLDITASLEDESGPDFLWLNNGITILATNAVISGGKNMLMQDIQVVNGLQTTESIYRHFHGGLSNLRIEPCQLRSSCPVTSDSVMKSFARQIIRAL
jgi:hypothetical protein